MERKGRLDSAATCEQLVSDLTHANGITTQECAVGHPEVGMGPREEIKETGNAKSKKPCAEVLQQ